VHAASQRLDVEGLRVIPVDPVANAPQQRQVAQTLRLGWSRGHREIVPPRAGLAHL